MVLPVLLRIFSVLLSLPNPTETSKNFCQTTQCYIPEDNAHTHHHERDKSCIKVAITIVYGDFISVAGAYNLLNCEDYCGEVQKFDQSCPFQGTILTLCWKDWGNHKNKICQSVSSDAYQDILKRSHI